jgi:molybdopterin synthase sulfur carrier subunit
MAVTLKFIGSLRRNSGVNEFALDIKGGSLIDLINKLTKQIPALRRNLLDEQLDIPKPNVLILVNGKEISVLNGLETKVQDGDEVVFVPVVHGG